MTETTPAKTGLKRQEGVTKRNLSAFFLGSFIAASMLPYISLSKDFILNTFLKIPPEQQGQVAGNLQTFREFVVLASIALSGVLADKIGRRLVFSLGFLLLGVSYALVPLAATVETLRYFYVVNGVGAAFITAMLSTVLADYVMDEDRGKAGGRQGLLLALSGLLLMPLLLALPIILKKAGLELFAAGRLAYTLVGALCLATAAILWLGLSRQDKPQAAEGKNLLQLAYEGITAIRIPGVALAYAAAFVSRGDLVVIGTFLKLWISKVALENNLDAAQASARGIPILLVSTAIQLISAPFFGRMADKLKRATALSVAGVIGAVAYGATYFIHDPLGKGMLLVAGLLGLAQISGLIMSQVLIAQQAPTEIRGSVIGFFGFCGALAQIILVQIGGRLYDGWREAGPFILVGGLNILLAAVALLMRPYMKREGA
jgi:MFS family permease